MKQSLSVIRTTIVGGVLFLAPFAILLLLLGKVFTVAVDVVVPLAELLPFQSLIGLRTPWVLASVLLLVICFSAGVLARTTAARRLVSWLESAVLSCLPGYSFMKTVGEEFAGSEPADTHQSVLLRLDEAYQFGFLVETIPGGYAVVFVPGAPKPWDGDVLVVEESRVIVLSSSSRAAVNCLRQLGAGASRLVDGKLD